MGSKHKVARTSFHVHLLQRDMFVPPFHPAIECKICRLFKIPRNATRDPPGFLLFSNFLLAVQILGDFQALCPISGVFGPKRLLPERCSKEVKPFFVAPGFLQEITTLTETYGDPKQRSPQKNRG